MSRLLERIRKYRDDRGMMANLRCLHIASKRHRAWPALNRLGVKIDDEVSGFIAGLFAVHPEETNIGNFGATCSAIEKKRNEKRSDDNKLTPTERRFQQLLTADSTELPDRVLRMVLMAKSQGVPVNYEKLESDLRFWNERTRADWASVFWAVGASQKEEEQ